MSLPRIVVRLQADDEIDDIARYIAARNLDAGKRFYDAVQGDMDRLAEFPGIGALRKIKNKNLRGLRSLPITGYRNYLIFYLPLEGGGIEVIHVLHGARGIDPIIEPD